MSWTLNDGLTVTFYRPSTAAVTVIPSNVPISGIDGDDGLDGKTIRYGTGAPLNTVGVDGDFYINTAYPPMIYGPKASGTWPSGTSLVGPQGPAGLGGGHPFVTAGM